MPQPYTGNHAAITAHQVPVISCPLDADAMAANLFNVPYQKLADFIAWLQANAALLSDENYFDHVLPIVLSRAGNQSIFKTNSGVLSVESAVNDVLINAAGGHNAILAVSGGAALTASDTALTANKPLAMGANPITGVADPTNPQDVVTKSYADLKGLVASTSAPCVSYEVTGSMAQVTNLSVGVTTNSRPVVIQIQPDGVNGGADMRIDAGATLSLRLLRNGTEIAKWFFGNGGTLAYGPMPAPFLDVAPGTGTRTYTVEAQATSGSARIDGVTLAAFTL